MSSKWKGEKYVTYTCNQCYFMYDRVHWIGYCKWRIKRKSIQLNILTYICYSGHVVYIALQLRMSRNIYNHNILKSKCVQKLRIKVNVNYLELQQDYSCSKQTCAKARWIISRSMANILAQSTVTNIKSIEIVCVLNKMKKLWSYTSKGHIIF